MKTLSLGFMLIASSLAFAQEPIIIEVPVPTIPEIYFGSLETELVMITHKLFKIAAKNCGSAENIALVNDLEVKLKLSGVNDIKSEHLEGFYPRTGIKAKLTCR